MSLLIDYMFRSVT